VICDITYPFAAKIVTSTYERSE